MVADQGLGGGMHGLRVERRLHAPDPAALQRRRRPAVEDAEEIDAPLGREAGVEVVRGGGGVQHRDGLSGEMGVQGVHHGGGRPVAGQVEVDHLARSVDPGVGASGGADHHPLAAEGLDRPLQRALHRGLAGLDLEAMIGRAVIFDRQAIARHQASRVP